MRAERWPITPRTGVSVPRALLSSLQTPVRWLCGVRTKCTPPDLGVLLEFRIWLENKEAFAVASGYSLCGGGLGL